MRKVLESLDLEGDEEMDIDVPLPLIEPSPVKQKKKRKSDDMGASNSRVQCMPTLIDSNSGRR